MLSKNEVIEILRHEQPYLKNHFYVKKMAIFGSFAKGKENSRSDVDIFVQFNKPVGVEFIRLADYLEKKLRRRIDILTPGGIKGIRIKRIARDIRRSFKYV